MLNKIQSVNIPSKSPCICLLGTVGLQLRSPITIALGYADKCWIKIRDSSIFCCSQVLKTDFRFAKT